MLQRNFSTKRETNQILKKKENMENGEHDRRNRSRSRNQGRNENTKSGKLNLWKTV